MTQRVIADRYELEEKLGTGGMGSVWKAHDRRLGRTVAVKLLHEGLAEDASFAERFRREARAAASLGHPSVVAVYDHGREEGVPFIVMEYISGESLHKVLQREGPLPVQDVARIGRSVLAALGHAHSRGLVHRDMKPANILCDVTAGMKVVDFGIAKGLEDTGGLTRTSGLIGTAAYLSPEQVNGHDATPASDQYALGCLLYACLAGDPPFSGPTPVAIAMRHIQDAVPPLRARRPDVPPEFEAIVMRALEKDPTRRFSSAAEMDAAIAATGLDHQDSVDPVIGAATPATATVAMRDHPVGAQIAVPAGTQVVRRTPPPASTRWLAALTAFLLVAAAGAVVALYLQSREQPVKEADLPAVTSTPVIPTQAPATTAPSPSPTVTPTEPPEQTPQVFNPPGIGPGNNNLDDDDEDPTATP